MLLAVLLAWVAVPALAQQDVRVFASVDRNTIGMGDMVELTVKVSGRGLSGIQEPQLPSLEGFQVVSTSHQQSISVIGTSMQSSMNYIYDLIPTRSGKLVIGAVQARIGGKVYSTTPITVVVHNNTTKAASPPGANAVPQSGSLFDEGALNAGNAAQSPVEVRHQVDHKTAYVGQQITYTFSFYQGDRLYGDVEYSSAETPGFVVDNLANPQQGYETLNGCMYSVQRRMKALFPTTAGTHTIGPASVSVATDAFSNPRDFVAKPISVKVLPLPRDGQPADFTGAVGSFHVTSTLDRQAVKAGETLTLTVEVRGDGNIRSLGAPKLSLPDWIRVYQAGEKRNISPGGGFGQPTIMGGTAVFTYLILPKRPGTINIPALQYPYFDPNAHVYRYASTKPLQVAVTPGSSGANTGQPLPTNGLRPQKGVAGRPVRTPVTSSPVFWLLQMLPLAVVMWAGWQRWQEHRLATDPDVARSGGAFTLARKRFDLAANYLAAGNQDSCYAELNAALADYIADRTAAPPSGLTADTAHDLLLQHGVDPALAEQARMLLNRTAAGRFAPGAGGAEGAQALVYECRELVAALQKQVRPQ